MSKRWIIAILSCIGVVAFSYRQGPQAVNATGSDVHSPSAPGGRASRPLRVLHIMSYDSSWAEWTLGQFEAFKEPLRDLPIEYRTFEMDVRRNTSEQWKVSAAAAAKQMIDDWKPDLVYTTDDFVQSAVVKDYLDTDLPFVFSGVNASPEAYGFDRASNVTGVLEREHIAQTYNLLRQIIPGARRVAVLSDRGETWPSVIARIRSAEAEMGVEIVSVDVVDTFEAYQQAARSYVGRVDAIITLGVYSLKGPDGKSVPIETAMRWTSDEIPLPNISFWTNRVSQGLLCAVAISSYAQGYRAGEIARDILVEGKRPCDIEIEPTIRGQPIINLSVARKLGLQVPSTVLLTAKVVNRNDWE